MEQVVSLRSPPPRPPLERGDADLQAFAELVAFFRRELARPEGLEGVAAPAALRAHLSEACARDFAAARDGLDSRPLRRFRRLRPLLSLPKGATILDYGGGYGADALFLASRGYRLVFYEITLGHIAIAEHFARRWREEKGPLEMRSLLRDRSGFEPFGEIDAVLLHDVAHHVEPVESVFAKCATILRPGGRLFLLEPNACNPFVQARRARARGLRPVAWDEDELTGERVLRGNEHLRFPSVWNRILRRCGFALESRGWLVPFDGRGESDLDAKARVRRALERLPLARALAATHLTSVYRLRPSGQLA